MCVHVSYGTAWTAQVCYGIPTSTVMESFITFSKRIMMQGNCVFQTYVKCVCDILKQTVVLDIKFLSVVLCSCESWSLDTMGRVTVSV